MRPDQFAAQPAKTAQRYEQRAAKRSENIENSRTLVRLERLIGENDLIEVAFLQGRARLGSAQAAHLAAARGDQ